MNARRYLIGLIFFVLAGQIPAATKSDTAKEKRWQDQIVPSLLVGEAVKLKADGTEFQGLYAPNTDKQTYGGVILIHSSGAHPAWPQIIEPLRIVISEHRPGKTVHGYVTSGIAASSASTPPSLH